MFTNSVLNFSKEKIDGIIIPTRHHWLSIDEKTGDITAIMPDRSQPVKYIIDVIVPAEGKFEIPKEVYCYKKTEQQYVNYKKPPKPFKSKFHKFVGSSLPELQSRARVQEYAGYSLTNSVRKHKAQFWWGNGSDGKSTMIEILSSLHCNPVSVKMSEIGLYNAHLIPASLIYATETPKKGFDEEFFKQAVTGDRVELRAIYGKKQNAHLTGKWILIMNELPHITDFTDGLARRVDIIRWPVQFKGDKVIEDLAYQIIKEEKQIVLYWCLEGLQRMIKNDWKFTESAMVSNAMRDWRNAADKVRLFCVERNYHYDEDKKKKSDKLSLFEAFNKWADYNNFERMSSTGFWMRMNNIFPQLKEDPDMKDKNTGRRACYLYVKAETLT
ncbi:hypothetical protein A8E62_31985 [Burkholderia cenocepacia]|nr:hypothetical protein A8E62_31985 [Burkholderia cenocepacia]ONU51177.1 hypothetical protein A8E67_35560 [Burkholderia cenocepacia]ONU71079.1 hypothetical protein A8E63_40880 [Burkholderia cenocepacia]